MLTRTEVTGSISTSKSRLPSYEFELQQGNYNCKFISCYEFVESNEPLIEVYPPAIA